MSQPDQEDQSKKDIEIYNGWLERLNKQHAVCMVGSDCVVMNEYWDPVLKKTEIDFSSFQSFRNRYMNRRIRNPFRQSGQPEFQDVGSLWLRSGQRREFERVIFDPSRNGNGSGNYFNMYRGFPFKPVRGSWDLLKNHIFEIVCSGNAEVFSWVLAWMARIVQKPGGERPGTAIVLKGVQGSGKGCVVNSFGRLFGPHYLQITQQDQLTGRFNTHLKDCLLLFCDEIIWGGDKKAEGILKGLITEPRLVIEPKNKDAFTVRSNLNLMVASNNDWVIPAGLEERRFCVLHVRPDRSGDRQYFNALHTQMANDGGPAMLYELLNIDYKSFDLRTIPRTGELLNQILNSMHPVHKFWYERLKDGSLLPRDSEWLDNVPISLLYESYCDFSERVSRSPRLSPTQFGKKLREVCPDLKRYRPEIGGERKWCYSVPDLAYCRANMADSVRMDIDWDE